MSNTDTTSIAVALGAVWRPDTGMTARSRHLTRPDALKMFQSVKLDLDLFQ